LQFTIGNGKANIKFIQSVTTVIGLCREEFIRDHALEDLDNYKLCNIDTGNLL
jgi:hypothetical protein